MDFLPKYFSDLPQEVIYSFMRTLDSKKDFGAISCASKLFQTVSQEIFKLPLPSCHVYVKCLCTQTEVCSAIHNLSMGILVIGWNESETTRRRNWANGIIVDLKTGEFKAILKKIDAELRQLMVDPFSKLIIGGLKTHTIAVWNVDGTLHEEFNLRPKNRYDTCEVHSFAICNSKTIAAKCYDQGQIKLISVKQKEKIDLTTLMDLSSVIDSGKPPQRCFTHCDGTRNLLCSAEGEEIKIYSLSLIEHGFAHEESILHVLDCPSSSNLSIYSEEKGYLIYPTKKNEVVIYDVNDESCRHVYLKDGERLDKLDYHEKEDHLILVTELQAEEKTEPYPRVWITVRDLKTGDQLGRFMTIVEKDLCHRVSSLIFLPESDLIIMGGHQACLLWDVKSGKLLRKISLELDAPVKQISYNPKTKQIYATQEQYGKSATSRIDFI